MKKLLLVSALVVLAGTIGVSAQTERKKRVAVLDFDYGTVRTAVSGIFGTDIDVGKGMTDLLVKHLVTDGTYSVIERRALDAVLNEQNFSQSDRANPTSAAQLGRLLGVDAIIVGTITQFGQETTDRRVGGLGRVAGGFGLGGVGRSATTAVVGVDARLVDVETGEILAVADGRGESKRSSLSLLGGGGTWGGFGAGGVDFSSSDFEQTILGEAVKAAVEQMSTGVVASNPRVAARTVRIEGLVAFAEGNEVVLNVGSAAGVQVGDQLSIERVTREIPDPATGRVIRRLTSAVATVQVTEVDAESAVARVVSGSGIQVGDLVRTPVP